MYKGGKWSGWRGWLAITDQRLWFEANVLGLFGTQEEIPIKEIAEVSLKNTLGFMPNCLWVRKKSGDTYDFIVNGRRQLLEIIRSRLSPE